MASRSSTPQSTDGHDASPSSTPPAVQVQRALDIYNNSKVPTASRGDTPPPPERKSRTNNKGEPAKASGGKEEGRRRYQFYVPDAPKESDRTRGGDPPEIINAPSSNTSSTPLGIFPIDNTPKEVSATAAEEAAQKVRSRLIRLQNHHKDLRDGGKYNLRKSTGGADGTHRRAEGKDDKQRSQSEVLASVSDYSGSPKREEKMLENKRGGNYDDNEEEEDDDDDFPNVNMDPIESDEEQEVFQYESAPNSPAADNNEQNVLNYPSSAPVDPARRGGQQQLMRHRFSGKGKFKPPFSGDEDSPQMQMRGMLKLPFVGFDENETNLRNSLTRQGSGLPGSAKQRSFRETGEVESLKDSIDYLRNLQIGARQQQQAPTHHPQVRTNRPPPPSFSSDEYNTMEAYDPNRPHRPIAPRKLDANPTADHIKKGRFLTAAEAMNYVMSASNRPCYAPVGGGINQAAADINETYYSNMSKEEVLEYGNRGGRAKLAASFDSEHNVVVEEDDDDFERSTSLSMHAEEKFGSSSIISASKHAEEKGGQHAQEHRRRTKSGSDSSLSISERDGEEVMRQFKSLDIEAPPQSRISDFHRSDSHLIRGNHNRRQRKPNLDLDPPDTNEYLKQSLISPSVLEKNTANQNLYAVETVIPSPYENYEEYNNNNVGSSSFDAGYTRRRSSGLELSSSSYGSSSNALGPRNKKPGGITGVNLEEYGNSSKQQYHRKPSDQGYKSSSFSDHEEASATSSVKSDRQNSIAVEPAYSSPRNFAGEVDAQSTGLMTMLCGHLLPLGGADISIHYDDSFCGMSSLFVQNTPQPKPTWNDNDPDEPGYVVHRLTNAELNSVELAFEKMSSAMNNNFERDLEEAEMILDAEEKRYQAEKKGLVLPSPRTPDSDVDSTDSAGKAHYGSSHRGSSPGHDSLDGTESHAALSHEDNGVRECVPDFPGIYPPGKGKSGELECFYLPIITKSQKTGFEPTKDLVLKSGSVFANNYLVQGELGSAAFSTAYRCIDLSSEEDDDGYQDEVCLKVIKNTKDYFDQSLDEIKILRLLKDTGKVQENNIVEMRSFFYHREHLVIVTELLRQNMYEFGKSIIESRGPPYFTRHRLSHITRQCLIALKFVHELGLMHCDIKPENILLRSYSRALVKVIDFGSSSFVSDRQSSYIQSRSYRAPEVILGLPYDGKIDMWSLGCVVAEMYTGEVTFQNDSEVSMLSRIEAICGPFPKHMIAKGRNSHRIFTDSGLIYEKVSRDNDENESHTGSADSGNDQSSSLFHIYQPKMTTMAARLGFDPDFMERPRLSEDDEKRALFIDFVSKLLTIDPDVRLTANEALKHPWILSSLDLTEDEIRYPPSD